MADTPTNEKTASGSQHSPLPWRLDQAAETIVDATGECLGYLYQTDGADDPVTLPMEANVRLIVTAVNVHADLLAACKAFVAAHTTPTYNAAVGKAKLAIAKAERQ